MHVLMVTSWLYTDNRPVLGSFFMEQAQAVSKKVSKMTVAFVEMSYLTVDRSNLFIEFTNNWFLKKKHDKFDEYRAYSNSYIPRNYKMYNYIIYLNLKRLVKKIILEKGEIDIIHLQSTTTHGYAVRRVSREFNIPYVITEHSTLFSRKKINKNLEKLIAPVIKEASEIACVGPGLKHDLSKYTNANINIIPNLVSDDFFLPLDGIKKKKGFHFVSVAFLTEKKGVDILLKSFSLHLEKYPNSKLSIGGDGPCKDKLKLLAQELKINKSVTFMGELSRKDVLIAVSTSHCFVLPSRHETFGVVFIEAHALGLPVIATKCDGPMSIINNTNGIVVEIDKVEELSYAMNEIVENYHIYSAKKIQENCYSLYSQEVIALEIIKMYKKVLAL